ncbi:MAG: ABC transporter permease [Bauldia sp.]|uniref:ABC transporter permease n=1 Tax=Bauldia sp. TaxID=2575872 RepID=UPI001D515D0E|nr:ABC transporter permease [Bauldia sp.]MCB1496805.1 ABC transporter permease [Bauldia sp.]
MRDLTMRQTAPAGFPSTGKSGESSLAGRILASRPQTLLILNVILIAAMAIAYPANFATQANFSAVLLNAAQSGILVVGMMILMIGGAFDLSIGSTLALSGVVAGALVGWLGYPAELGILAGIATGAAAGLVNGLIVTRLGINPLIATLATLSIYRSLTQLIGASGVTPISNAFKFYGQVKFLGLQSPFWVMLVIVVLGAWAVARTKVFRQYYFIGGNARAAQLSGINVPRLTLMAFVLMGALAGLAGVLAAARLNSAVVSAGIGVELSVITATVLGGASLKGGEGTIIGGVLGVLFIALVQNAMIINGIGVFWQGMIIGLVLLLAVSLNRFKQRSAR